MPDLSIIIPTCQRAPLLRRCLASIQTGTHCDYEIIVVDGASTDGTRAVLSTAKKALGNRLRVIREKQRQGFVRAANRGFQAAAGRHLLWLNDDARPRPGAIDLALAQMISSTSDVGLLALFHAWTQPRNIAYQMVLDRATYRLLHIRGTLYANFGLGRRDTFAALGYFDDGFYFNGADPDFSLKVWQAGLRVEPAYGAAVDHEEFADARREADAQHGERDNQRLFSKWRLPPKNLRRNDFDPFRPCTLLSEPQSLARAG